MTYLDNASTTKIDDRVFKKMGPFLKEQYGNAGTLYTLGRTAAKAIEKARKQVADLIGASPDQIIFTSGGTEANNMAFLGTREYLVGENKTHIITSQIEHESILHIVKNICETQHIVVGDSIKSVFYASYVPPRKNSTIYGEDVIKAIEEDKNTGIVSIMHTNNETGLKTVGLNEIGKTCRSKGILFHTDCVQALGENRINVNEIGCDLMSISSHKIHGPKGVGALYVKNKALVQPLIHGGNSQEFGLRGGTENVAGIVGFGEACEILNESMQKDSLYIAMLREIFYNSIVAELSKYGLENVVHINGDVNFKENGKTLNLRFDDVDGETLLLMLDSYGVCASAGSACRSHESTPSYVLTSMGIDEENARNSVRFSFSRMNSYREVKEAAKVVAICIHVLHV